jgi:ElaB/YqjD/DUF883 family membrane-anchored ribosome-binding protein
MNTPDSSTSTHPFPTSGSQAMEHPAGSNRGAQTASNAGDEMLERIVQVAHSAIDRLADNAAPHVHRWQEQLGHASETLSGKTADLRGTGDEWANNLRDTVREHPLAAVATAVAVGLLVARLTR